MEPLTWTMTRTPFETPFTRGHMERHTAQVGDAVLVITHRSATVETTRLWDVGARVNGRSFDRLFEGQPLHESPDHAKTWVEANMGLITPILTEAA